MTHSPRILHICGSAAVAAGVLLSGAILLPQTAAAALGSPCESAGGNDFTPGGGGTLQQLFDTGGCQDRDKFYDILSFSNPVENPGPPGIGDVLVEITTFVEPPTDPSLHSFQLVAPPSSEGPNYTFAGTYNLRYSIEIDIDAIPGADPEEVAWRFGSISLDTDVGGTAVTVQKRVYRDNTWLDSALIADLISTNGSSELAALEPQYTKIWIDETFTLAGLPNGILFTATNLTTQLSVNIPERVPTPGILSLLGLGLLGLIGTRVRARNAGQSTRH